MKKPSDGFEKWFSHTIIKVTRTHGTIDICRFVRVFVKRLRSGWLGWAGWAGLVGLLELFILLKDCAIQDSARRAAMNKLI